MTTEEALVLFRKHLKTLTDLSLYIVALAILVVGLMFGIGGFWLQLSGLLVIFILGLVVGVTVFFKLGVLGLEKAKEE